MSDPDPCPCGSGRESSGDEGAAEVGGERASRRPKRSASERDRQYADCCGPLLATERLAETAEELMRSRYTAYHYGNAEHLWRTWHPRTRPSKVVIDPGVRWEGLHIHSTRGGQPGDEVGLVDFTATHDEGELRELARFERRAGRWFYLGEEPS